MTPIDDCCWVCQCGRVLCGDDFQDCGHADEPTCSDCCERLHQDELIREAMRDALMHWGREAS